MDVNPLQLILESATALVRGFFEHLPQFAIALVVLVLTLLAARLLALVVGKVMKKSGVRQALVTLSANLIGIASWIVGAAISITILFPSVTPAQLIAGLGLTSVAIGFAFKDVFENFLAGVIILAREKMRIGDIIECEDVFGRIENISVRETHVRETDGELVIVPNAHLFMNPLKIQTDQELKRQELVVGVDYDADLGEVTNILEGVLDAVSSVNSSKPTEVACIAFGGSSIDFKMLWWTDSEPKDQRRSYHEVALAVKTALDSAGVDIPFPQTTLSFRPDATPIKVRGGKSEAERTEMSGQDR